MKFYLLLDKILLRPFWTCKIEKWSQQSRQKLWFVNSNAGSYQAAASLWAPTQAHKVWWAVSGPVQGAYLQEAVLAAEELAFLQDGFSGQDQFLFAESRLFLTREDCLKFEKETVLPGVGQMDTGPVLDARINPLYPGWVFDNHTLTLKMETPRLFRQCTTASQLSPFPRFAPKYKLSKKISKAWEQKVSYCSGTLEFPNMLNSQ